MVEFWLALIHIIKEITTPDESDQSTSYNYSQKMINPEHTNNPDTPREPKRIVYLSPPSIYSMADNWYDFVTPSHFWIQWRFAVIRKLLPKANDWGNTLDIGCGNGAFGQQIESHYGILASGCDLNEKALRTISHGYDQVYFYNIHQRNAEFEGYFSTIFLMDVLEHIENPVEFLQSASYHLSPKGKIIINVPAIQMLYSKYDTVAGHVKRYHLTTITTELTRAGYQIESAGYWGLALVPLLLIRKWVLNFFEDKDVIEIGFQPNSQLIRQLLNLLMSVETKLFARTVIGSSLLVIARKRCWAPNNDRA